MKAFCSILCPVFVAEKIQAKCILCITLADPRSGDAAKGFAGRCLESQSLLPTRLGQGEVAVFGRRDRRF